LFPFIGRKHHFESFCAADADLVILLELGGRRIFVPTVLVLYCRSIDAIEIAAPGYCRCNGNWIAHLHAFWFCLSRHREVSARAAAMAVLYVATSYGLPLIAC